MLRRKKGEFYNTRTFLKELSVNPRHGSAVIKIRFLTGSPSSVSHFFICFCFFSFFLQLIFRFSPRSLCLSVISFPTDSRVSVRNSSFLLPYDNQLRTSV